MASALVWMFMSTAMTRHGLSSPHFGQSTSRSCQGNSLFRRPRPRMSLRTVGNGESPARAASSCAAETSLDHVRSPDPCANEQGDSGATGNTWPYRPKSTTTAHDLGPFSFYNQKAGRFLGCCCRSISGGIVARRRNADGERDQRWPGAVKVARQDRHPSRVRPADTGSPPTGMAYHPVNQEVPVPFKLMRDDSAKRIVAKGNGDFRTADAIEPSCYARRLWRLGLRGAVGYPADERRSLRGGPETDKRDCHPCWTLKNGEARSRSWRARRLSRMACAYAALSRPHGRVEVFDDRVEARTMARVSEAVAPRTHTELGPVEETVQS